jgi:hypothetical protein
MGIVIDFAEWRFCAGALRRLTFCMLSVKLATLARTLCLIDDAQFLAVRCDRLDDLLDLWSDAQDWRARER